jgi:tetratricopeptide (TPR) repeat protein
MTQKLFPLFFVVVIAFNGTAQKTDSLESVLKTAQGDQKVKTLNELFRAHLQSDPVKAIGYAREALNLATEINDSKGMAAAYNNLGVAYRNQGALDKSLEYYLKSLKIYTDLDNKDGIATTKSNIATIYSLKKDYQRAMKYLEESYALFNESGDKVKIVGTMNNLGNLYTDIKMYEKAEKFYNNAFAMSEKSGLKSADPLMNLGNIYFRQGNYDKAAEHYEKALQLEKASGNSLGILNIETNLGIMFVKAKRTTQAQTYLDHAKQLTDELQAFTMLPAIYKASAENYFNQGKFKEAYLAQQKFEEVREKIYGDESSRNIAQMELAMSFQEKEKELDMLRKEDTIKSLELHNTRLVIVMVILGIFLLLAGVNLFYTDRKKKLV